MSVNTALNTLKLNGRIAVIYSADPAQVGSVIYRSYNTRSWKSYQKVANDIKVGLEQAGFKHVICLADDQHLARQLAENKIDFAWLNTGGDARRRSLLPWCCTFRKFGDPLCWAYAA